MSMTRISPCQDKCQGLLSLPVFGEGAGRVCESILSGKGRGVSDGKVADIRRDGLGMRGGEGSPGAEPKEERTMKIQVCSDLHLEVNPAGVVRPKHISRRRISLSKPEI